MVCFFLWINRRPFAVHGFPQTHFLRQLLSYTVEAIVENGTEKLLHGRHARPTRNSHRLIAFLVADGHSDHSDRNKNPQPIMSNLVMEREQLPTIDATQLMGKFDHYCSISWLTRSRYAQNDQAPSEKLFVVRYDGVKDDKWAGKWLEWILIKVNGGMQICEFAAVLCQDATLTLC